MKNKVKKFFHLMMAAVLALGVIPASASAAAAPQPAMWPVQAGVKITQLPNDSFSHKGTQYVDVVGFGGNSNLVAPFDCKVVQIWKGHAEGNSVVVQSLDRVLYANGDVDYATFIVAHDNNISDLKVGKILKQGTVFYQTGNYGNVTGVHCHMTAVKGKYLGDIWSRNSYGNCTPKNAISPTQMFWVTKDTKIIDSKGLTFKTYSNCKHPEFRGGYCVSCGQEAALKYTYYSKPVLYKINKKGSDSAPIWNRPYSVQAQKLYRLHNGAMVSVIGEVVNQPNDPNGTGNRWLILSAENGSGHAYVYAGNAGKYTGKAPTVRFVDGSDGGLNINSKAKSGYSIGVVPEGGMVVVNQNTKAKNGYVYVTYDNMSGWCYSKYLDKSYGG